MSLRGATPQFFESAEASQQDLRREWANMSPADRFRVFSWLKNRNQKPSESYSLRNANIEIECHGA